MNPPVSNLYDPVTAAVLVQFAADAYSPHPSNSSDCQVVENEATDTRVVIYTSATDIVVAFRGTADIRNWLTDVDARMVELWPLGESAPKVHAGFSNALDSVFRQLIAIFYPLKMRRLWLTGHSLGGALAMLAAARYFGATLAGVYTFGQPRVGNAAFRDAYNKALGTRTFRVVHHRDIVPHLPWLCGRYRHAGQEAWYAQDDPSSLYLDRSALAYALDDVTAMAGAWVNPRQMETWLFDHHVSQYQKLFVGIANDKFSMANSQSPQN